MKRLWFILTVVVVSVTLSGCLGATTHITMNKDGSGNVEVVYRISKLVAYIGAQNGEGRYLSLPLNEKELLALLEPLSGATLKKYSTTSDDTDIVISASIDFDSKKTLKLLFGSFDNTALDIVTDENNQTVFSLTVYQGLGSAPDETVKEMITTFFSDYDLVWDIRAPADIVSATAGEIDGPQATITYHTADVLLSQQPIVWELHW